MTRYRTAVPIAAREADVLRAVTDYLAAKRIFFMRLNTGSFAFGEGKSRRFFRAGRPGCADVIALPKMSAVTIKTVTEITEFRAFLPIWLEAKTAVGKQSAEQKAFQCEVEAHGMIYAIVRSIEDLRGLGL